MFHVLVKLEVIDFDALETFEKGAALIMKSYGGEIVTAFEMEETSANTEIEIHLLQFPSKLHFEQYCEDQRLNGLSELRAQAISTTEVTVSRKLKSYA